MLKAKDFKDFVSGRRKGPDAMLLRGLMWGTSKLYGLGVRIRNRQFDSGKRPAEQVGVPVISVGNLTLGGTGKTPMVAWLAKWFRDQEIRVALVSRGYGAEQGAQNDEAKELEQLLPDVPHLQNPDRIEAAKVAVEELGMQVILLDDAFQHRRIARDLDIVLIDATEPFGFEHLFPRGTLREPLANLARADALVLTRGDMVSADEREQIWQRLRKYNATAPQLELSHQPCGLRSANGSIESASFIRGKPVVAFCGIGNPQGFLHTLRQSGLEVLDLREFDDHYAYERPDVESLMRWARSYADAGAVICTHKDLVKIGLETLGEKPLWALCVEATVNQGQELLEASLRELMAKIPEDAYAE